MIEVKVVDGKFLIKGSFNLGIAGTYVNDDFDGDKLCILDSFEEVVDDYTDDKYSWGVLEPYLKDKELTEENVAKAIADYYNALEQKVAQCIMQINSNLLVNVFQHMEDCGFEFWEIEGAYIEEKMPDCSEDEIDEIIYQANWDAMSKLNAEYYETPNDNSLEKTDAEKKLREMYPMFNMDGLIEGIVPEVMSFNGKYFSFQCSDSWGEQIMCSAYDELDEQFRFTDWHNF